MPVAEELENHIFAEIAADNFAKAIEYANELDALLSRTPSLGLTPQSIDALRRELFSLFGPSEPPAVVGEVAPEYRQTLRIAAALALLGRDKASRNYLRGQPDIGSRLSSEVAVRMWVFATYHRLRIKQMKSTGIATVRILGGNDACHCDACRAINRLLYPIDNAPEFPYELCTSERGCRCKVTAIIQDNPETES